MPLIPAFSRLWGAVCVSEEEFLARLSSSAFARFEAEFELVPSVDLRPTDALTLVRLRCYLEQVPFDEVAARAAIGSPPSRPAPEPLAWLSRFSVRKVG